MTSEQFGAKVPPAAVYLSFFFLCPLMVKKKKFPALRRAYS